MDNVDFYWVKSAFQQIDDGIFRMVTAGRRARV